jgi:glucose-6-phosphate isomerase
LHFLQDKDYGVCVISKSGSTTETAVAFRLLRQQMAKKYSAKEMNDRTMIITEKKPSSLRQLCDEEQFPNLIHPDDVGGRFSVLSPVGLLPIAVAGIDIRTMLAGAQAVRQQCLEELDLFANLALFYAASRYLLYKKGKKIELMSAFDASLPFVTEWWKQLFGESEGKNHKGLFPASTQLTTDLHSLGQYIQDGERKLFETFLRLESPDEPIGLQPMPTDLDQLNYLDQALLQTINQKAYEGTALAHYQGGVPNMTITLSKRSAYDLGQLFYFLQFSVAVSGLLLKVNPFDQPGVEDYKNNMFALLGKASHANRRKKAVAGLKQLDADGWTRLSI